MATSIWPWRRTMRERVLLIVLTASPRIEKRGTMYREYRMPTSGRDRVVLRMHSSIHARSTESSRLTAASYSRTNRTHFNLLVLSFYFSGRPELEPRTHGQ